jgi:hypothetical protein
VLFPAVRHELSFWYGNNRLVGDLVLPPTAGPHPVLLVVGEPNITDRDYSFWLDDLAEAGIASFTWDRPVWPADAPDPVRRVADHAREVLTAIDRLRCLSEVDVTAVALAGWGEGGWAAAQAATFSSQVRALILAATPTVPPTRLLEHRLVMRLRAAGHTGSDVVTARDVIRRRLDGLLAGSLPAEVDADSAGYQAERWYQDLAVDERFAHPSLVELTADPLPTLSAVSAPVLALFGEQDSTLPLEDSVRGVRTALEAAGHRDHRIAVVRGGDHVLRVRPGHGLGALADGRHQFGEWPTGLTQVIGEWLDVRIRATAALSCSASQLRREASAALPAALGRTHPHGARSGALPVRQLRRRISL